MSEQGAVTAVRLVRVEALPRPGWFHVCYMFYWEQQESQEYRITIEAEDELGAVVDWRAWARANKYQIKEPDDGEAA